MSQTANDYIVGQVGSASPINRDNAPYPETSIAFWLLHIPGFHPLWNHYALSIVGLKDYPGVPKAVKNYPKAEFEIMFSAVDSSKKPQADDINSIHPINPINYLEQFHGVSSERAAQAARVMVKAFVEGSLFPESQGIVGARDLFKQTLDLALKQAN